MLGNVNLIYVFSLNLCVFIGHPTTCDDEAESHHGRRAAAHKL